MADSRARGEDDSSVDFRLEEQSMRPHPFIDLAAQLARIFVVGMSITAAVAVPALLILALLR
jgi:hypothetical protein